MAGAGERREEAPSIRVVDAAVHKPVALEARHEVGDPARSGRHVPRVRSWETVAGRVEQRDQHVEFLDRDVVGSRERRVKHTHHGVVELQATVPRAKLRVGQVCIL